MKHENDPLYSLFEGVAARPAPPHDIQRAIYQQSLQDWQSIRQKHRPPGKYVAWAIAASIFFAVLTGSLLYQSTRPLQRGTPVGLIALHNGSVTLNSDGQSVQLAEVDKRFAVFAGQTLSTAGAAGVALEWGKGNSVRIDQNTEIRFVSASDIELLKGRIYVDIQNLESGAPSPAKLQISTKFATINHLGTQFMVTSDADSVDVAVREGSVSIKHAQQTLTLIRPKGSLTRLGQADIMQQESISSFAPQWQWAMMLAPGYQLEGHTLLDFIRWVGRETGKEIRFNTPAARQIATKTILHGNIDQPALPALDLVLQTNDLSWSEQNNSISFSVTP